MVQGVQKMRLGSVKWHAITMDVGGEWSVHRQDRDHQVQLLVAASLWEARGMVEWVGGRCIADFS